MPSVSNANFGPLIAYLVPGAAVLWGLSLFSPTLSAWFAGVPTDAPTIGGFLYLTLASLGAGMTISALRWAIVDTVYARTGLSLPPFDFSRLGRNVAAFSLMIEIHYRHYLFYANMLVATAIAYICYRAKVGLLGTWDWRDLGVAVIEFVFIAMSRDCLRKYYFRGGQVLSPDGSRRRRRRA